MSRRQGSEKQKRHRGEDAPDRGVQHAPSGVAFNPLFPGNANGHISRGTFELSAEGLLTAASAQFLNQTGFTPEDVAHGLVFSSLFIDQDRSRLDENIRQVLAGGLFQEFELTVRRKDGSTFDVMVCGCPVAASDGPSGIRGVMVDASCRRQVESEVIERHKLEALATLAGGLAHDFNNLLTAIVGNIELVQENLPAADPNRELLEAAIKAVYTANDLTSKFITFSSGGLPVKEPSRVERLLNVSASLSLSGSNIEHEITLPADLLPIEADQRQMYQVFNNIISNAREAMPDGGRLLIRAENIGAAAAGLETGQPMPAARYVKISFIDSGNGIRQEILPKIFNAYFSTKERGAQKGMGLGLTIANSIVRKHGGTVRISSDQGDGTTVTIYLPAIAAMPATSPQASLDGAMVLPLQASRPGNNRVLFMDDDSAMLEMIGFMLNHLGFDFELAKNGEETIEKYSRMMQEKPFGVVVLDLTIKGGMGGRETLEKLLEIDPGVRAVATSGYHENPVMSNHLEYGFVGILPKPYRMNQIREVLGRILEEDSGLGTSSSAQAGI